MEKVNSINIYAKDLVMNGNKFLANLSMLFTLSLVSIITMVNSVLHFYLKGLYLFLPLFAIGICLLIPYAWKVFRELKFWKSFKVIENKKLNVLDDSVSDFVLVGVFLKTKESSIFEVSKYSMMLNEEEITAYYDLDKEYIESQLKSVPKANKMIAFKVPKEADMDAMELNVQFKGK